MTVRLLIIDAPDTKTTTVTELFNYDIVLSQHPDGSGRYEVLKNLWNDRRGTVNGSDVDKFLDVCGVRSAT